ncbi:unnamed protein product [Phytomonas sp. EM1]|nr:unnamed protein product [Phytomonas sp. EM1]|eukprot:CCW63571.1 unnamed protein product [Phytomonas sp. isolate EM1]
MASECIERIIAFSRKFLSLFIAIILAIAVAIYVVGSSVVISKDKSFGNIGFSHFLGILLTATTTLTYITLHFLPRKAYRLLYAITLLLLFSILFCAHSLGLTAPTVTDCGKDEFMQIIANLTETQRNVSIEVGSLGQEINTCSGNDVLFAGSLIAVIMMVAAIFDVQMVLLHRVRSKTYGERFVEMGITN